MKAFTLIGAVLTLFSLNSWGGPSVTSGNGFQNPMYLCQSLKVAFYDVENSEYMWRLCAFDGLIDSRTLTFHRNNDAQLAIKAFFSSRKRLPEDGTSQPASRYCTASGGKSLVVTGANGEMHICEFKDESVIEEWTLYYGVTSEKNANLTRVLNQKVRNDND